MRIRLAPILSLLVTVALVPVGPAGAAFWIPQNVTSSDVDSNSSEMVLIRGGSERFGPDRDSVPRRQSAARGESTPAAERALRRAKRLFAPDSQEQRSTGKPEKPSRDATLVLRDLAFRADELSSGDQRAAQRILARPANGAADPMENGYRVPEEVGCTTTMCFHWVTSTEDAPPLADSDADSIPDWVETNGAVFEHVWSRIVADYGYRTPKGDATSTTPGPDGRLDIYLADIGPDGYYGYCTTDDPAVDHRYDVSAYCVMDNDFAYRQFGAPPLESLKVTAAHEFFHAVQFAYDWREDAWLMEGTAAWMEDEIYDSINDNHQYFSESALKVPDVPVDFAPAGTGYGSWVFWRFLAEYFGSANQSDPTVIRRIWQRADASPTGRDEYSLQAVRNVTAALGQPFARTFADFGAVNRIAKSWYEEGRSYPEASVAAAFTLTRSKPGTPWRYASVDHLTNVNVKFRPGQSLTGKWRLAIGLDLPKTLRGSAATVAVKRRDGSTRWYDVRLNQAGDKVITVPFTRRTVSYVVLTMTNASTRYACWQRRPLSCSGFSPDNNLKHWFKVQAVR